MSLHGTGMGVSENMGMPGTPTVCTATDCPLRREHEAALMLERQATVDRAEEAHALRLTVVELRHRHGLALTRLRALGVDTKDLQLPEDHA